jgi:TPR repeat protein
MRRSKSKSPRASDLDEAAKADYRRALALARRGRVRHAKEVTSLLKGAAQSGHAMAAHALATWYIYGIGVRKNFATAMMLEEQAARAGILDAICNLARAYETGKGVQKDASKSHRLYRRASALGDVGAPYEVGRQLFYGIGIRPNERLARKWIARSKTPRSVTDDPSGKA